MITIRSLKKEDDRLAVSRVYEESWKFAYRGIIPEAFLNSIPTGGWAEHLEDAGKKSLVLLDGDTIAGTSSICPSRWADARNLGEVVSIYLLPAYMGKGYGRRLMQAAVEQLHEDGFSDIMLWVLEENSRARRFYEAFGFVLWDAVREDAIGGRKIREVQYRYHVPAV